MAGALPGYPALADAAALQRLLRPLRWPRPSRSRSRRFRDTAGRRATTANQPADQHVVRWASRVVNGGAAACSMPHDGFAASLASGGVSEQMNDARPSTS